MVMGYWAASGSEGRPEMDNDSGLGRGKMDRVGALESICEGKSKAMAPERGPDTDFASPRDPC